jgi:hypothetical protein
MTQIKTFKTLENLRKTQHQEHVFCMPIKFHDRLSSLEMRKQQFKQKIRKNAPRAG